MKTKVASLLVVLLIATAQLSAQKKITVEARNNDISYNLDLRAVASIFGESRNLEEFEMKLNDYDSGISNLDLNDDGEVDYLRVIETTEKNLHVVVIQAVLDRDVYQDVATIVVEKERNRNIAVQIIGDPYMYGMNYIIEPVYIRTPRISSFFWNRRYYSWNSPYYWGYYPTYYRYRRPYEVNIYLSHVHSHINYHHSYRYTNTWRNSQAVRLHSNISRNDYGTRYPERTFSNRNQNIRNKNEFQTNRDNQNKPNNSYNESVRRSSDNTNRVQNGNQNVRTTNRTSNSENRNVTTPTRVSERGSNNRTYTPSSTTTPRTNEMNRGRTESNQRVTTPSTNSGTREGYQSRPSTNSSNKPATKVTRETPTRQTPVVKEQPSTRRTESKPTETKSTESRSTDTKSDSKTNRSSNRR